MRRVTVVYVPHPHRRELFHPFGDDVVAAVGTRHDLAIYEIDRGPVGQLEGAEVVIDHGGQARTHEMADACRSLKLWQILGTGVDDFDLGYWMSKGIPVANTPGPCSADSLAEGALMLILMLSRQYPVATAGLRRGVMYLPVGMELVGRTLGMVGFGASARALSVRARALGMRLHALDMQEVSPAEREEFGLEWTGGPERLDELVASSNFLSLHLPLNADTRHIIDARRLALMRPDGYVINVARGGLVDEAALEQALLEGRLAGAGLDAFGQEPPDASRALFQLPNVIATPHSVATTDGTSRRRAQCVAENVDRIAAGLQPLHRVA